jgi:hypothetical protein
MNDVKLRDQRKPGHCWQDNELYDAFGPVIGPNAVLVYVQMTRNCWGTEIRSSSRDLARDSGLSKDTVLRSMRAMERVGMLRAVGAGCRRVAEYNLVDLKELAQHHGGSFDRRRVSYVFTEQQIAALKAIATGAGRDSQDAGVQNLPGAPAVGATGAGGDSRGPSTGALRDSGLSLCATDLAHQKPTTGAGEAHVSFSASQDSRLQDNPPTPRTAGGLSEGESIEEKIAALRAQRAALEIGSLPWLKVSRALHVLLAMATPREPSVETGADPPLTPGRRRRRHG